MYSVMQYLLVIVWIFIGLMALGASISFCLFVHGLLRFILHERRLAANWNKIVVLHMRHRDSTNNAKMATPSRLKRRGADRPHRS
jgi:hypothetical protein